MTNIVPWADQERMAQAIAQSGLFGLKDKNQVLALMAVAQAEGRHPASVARDYHLIEGRPALKADAMLARFQAAGGLVEWLTYTDAVVEAHFHHPQGGDLKLSWTFEQARKAGISMGRNGPKDNWAKYPRAMLRARVISEGIRTVFPGVLVGEYTPEEVSDFLPPPKAAIAASGMELVDELEGLSEEAHDDSIPLFVPDPKGPKVYSRYMDGHDWMDGYLTILDKINSSQKLSEAEKEQKREEFKEINKDTRDAVAAELEKDVNNG